MSLNHLVMIAVTLLFTGSIAAYCTCGSYSATECEAFYQAGCPGSTCFSLGGGKSKTGCKASCGSLSMACSGKNSNGKCRCFSTVFDPSSWAVQEEGNVIIDDDEFADQASVPVYVPSVQERVFLGAIVSIVVSLMLFAVCIGGYALRGWCQGQSDMVQWKRVENEEI
eukprot:494453_1